MSSATLSRAKSRLVRKNWDGFSCPSCSSLSSLWNLLVSVSSNAVINRSLSAIFRIPAVLVVAHLSDRLSRQLATMRLYSATSPIFWGERTASICANAYFWFSVFFWHFSEFNILHFTDYYFIIKTIRSSLYRSYTVRTFPSLISHTIKQRWYNLSFIWRWREVL